MEGKMKKLVSMMDCESPCDESTDHQFLEMAFHARHVDSDMMFRYFDGTLDEDEECEIEECARKSPLFLQSMVEIGHLVSGENA